MYQLFVWIYVYNKNRYKSMRLSLLAISIILALQATTLLYNSQPRFIFHNTLRQIQQLTKPITSALGHTPKTNCCNCFYMDEELRFGMVAFTYASAFILFTGEAVWPAFVSQLFWIVFQTYLCTDQSLANIRNFAVQALLLFVLWTNLQCCEKNSCSKKSAPIAAAPVIAEKTEIAQSSSSPVKKECKQHDHGRPTRQNTGKNNKKICSM